MGLVWAVVAVAVNARAHTHQRHNQFPGGWLTLVQDGGCGLFVG